MKFIKHILCIIILILLTINIIQYNEKLKIKKEILDKNDIISKFHLKWYIKPTERKNLLSTVGSTGPYGIHSYCDWVIGCRQSSWKKIINFCWGNPNILPKLVFVACVSFKFFFYKIYPYIPKEHKYIIIIGDADATLPYNIDKRSYKDSTMTSEMWDEIVKNPQIMHIFCTHLVIPASKKYSPLPVGFNPHEHCNYDIDTLLKIPINLDIMNKPLTIKGCCRVREDSQHDERRIVKNLCLTKWNKFSHWGSIPKEDFFKEIQNFSFLLCAHGGGIEPNPKAFSAIYVGTIPIMKKFINCEILYKDMPVVFIDEWNENAITIEKMEKWRNELKPYFYDPVKRAQVVEKMTTKYWLQIIMNKFE